MKMAHYLATSSAKEAVAIRAAMIVIVEPIQNPDGRERFVGYCRDQVSPRTEMTDPAAMSHNQPWPSGRTNHYLFDLNRDWVVLSQKETREHLAAVLAYRPQLFVDHHEMGTNSSYYFPPPAPPVSPTVANVSKKWWPIIGNGIATEFDRRGISYFTEEIYDNFYPGYAGGWLSFVGGVAMTFEQSTAHALKKRRDDGSIVTLADGAEHHFLAGLATLTAVAGRKDELLRDTADYFADAKRRAAADPVRAYLFLPRPNEIEAARLARNLAAQGIMIERTATAVEVENVVPLVGGSASRTTVPAGTFAVRTSQPFYDLIKTLFLTDVPLEDDFLAEDEARVKRGERSYIYDVTAWNVAFSAGIEAFEVHGELPASFVGAANDLGRNRTPKSIQGASRAPAYLVRSDTGDARRFVSAAARIGISARVTTHPFTSNGVPYPRGSIVCLSDRNPADLEERLALIAASGIEIVGAKTMLTESGFDLGSAKSRPVVAPRIAVIGNLPTDPYSFGGVKWFLEEELEADYTPIHSYMVEKVDLSAWNVIVLPDGDDWSRWLGEKGVAAIKDWVDVGGTLVLLRGAAEFLRSGEKPWLRSKSVKIVGLEPARGPIVRAEIVDTHWLAAGSGREILVQLRGVRPHENYPDREAGENVATLKVGGDLGVSGLLRADQSAAFGGRQFVGVEKHGAGHVVIFSEDPVVRANMPGLFPLMAHAVLLGPTFRPGY